MKRRAVDCNSRQQPWNQWRSLKDFLGKLASESPGRAQLAPLVTPLGR